MVFDIPVGTWTLGKGVIIHVRSSAALRPHHFILLRKYIELAEMAADNSPQDALCAPEERGQ